MSSIVIKLPMPLLILAAVGSLAAAAEQARTVPDWGAAMDAAKADAGLAATRDKLLVTAREVGSMPIIKRVYRAEDVGKFRSSVGERTVVLDGSVRRSMFALAKSDNVAAVGINGELPLLAVAYRWTGDETFKARVIAQLEETATWSPLQRPGWSLKAPSSEPLPPKFHDGCWLATGWCIRAIADTLEIMPAGSLPQPLIDKLHSLLAREIAGIVDDWRTKPSWFLRSNNPRTNQWMVPTEGLIRACLVLGKEKHPAQYELGVRNLLASLDAQGPQGECHEGIMYAALSVESLLHAARAMAVAGDRRAADHPFFGRFAIWLAHHAQPGRAWINCFDVRLNNDGRCRQLLSLLLLLGDDPVARWTLATQFGGPQDDIAGLAFRSTQGPSRAPALFASYQNACRVNWRSSWADDATGVWVRGGHPLDGHDHYDRGHVNFIFHGRPILIEAGTPRDYGDPQMKPLYQSIVGHNVLEVKGCKTEKEPAPIRVIRLDATGGEVLVDPTPGYADVKHWQRRVTWNADRLEVTDEVTFPPDRQQVALFRWHLATEADVKPQADGRRFTLSWSDATMTLESSVPTAVTTVSLPDNTVYLSEKPTETHLHRCVIIETNEPATAWTLKTTVVGKR
jgi:hypothetical protein